MLPWIGTCLFLITLGTAEAQTPYGNCAHIDSLRESFKTEPYIYLEFIQVIASDIFETTDTVDGALWAGHNGLFRLETPHQQIVSNGILYWSYSPENKQVLEDSIAQIGDWEPLTILYDPEGIYECFREEIRLSKIIYNMRVRDSLTLPESFKLAVSRDKYIPQSIGYQDENGSQINIYITNFRHISTVPDSVFIFDPPPGVEIIRMP